MPRFAIDPGRSRLWIDARSSLHPIRAETAGLEGWLEAELLEGDRIHPTGGQLTLPMQLLSSGNQFYDREMRRRVDIRRFPTVSGELSSVTESDGDGRYVVEGDLTFRGVTRRYADQITLSAPDDLTLRLEGSHTFDIRDFGMEPPRILALRVYPEVDVKVVLLAERTEEEA